MRNDFGETGRCGAGMIACVRTRPARGAASGRHGGGHAAPARPGNGHTNTTVEASRA